MDRALLTAQEASAYLRVSVPALAQMRYLRKGPPYVRLGQRSIRYREVDLYEWVDTNTVRAFAR